MSPALSRRAFAGAAVAAAFTDSAHAQTRSQKFALVIANSDYDGDGRVDTSSEAVMRAQARGFVGDLPNPWFDAVRVSEALRGVGFSVQTVLNADRATMHGAVAQLRARVNAAGPTASSVIYYAGHGVQLGGRAYLVATRATLTPEQLVGATADERLRIGMATGLSVQDLLMQQNRPAAPGYNLILLDACRDNPWEPLIRAERAAEGRDYVGERGFMAMSVMTPRTVLSFSAQPGQGAQDGITGAGSPFASAFVSRVRAGANVDDTMRSITGMATMTAGALQQPWVNGRLGDATTF